jgi:hypothetical protein
MATTSGLDDANKTLAQKGRRSKYGNVRSVYDGRTYVSKLEARHAAELDLLKRAGEIRGWLPAISLPIPGTKRRMIVDFLVIRSNGALELHDTKGVITKDWALKRELIETALGVPIVLVKGR